MHIAITSGRSLLGAALIATLRRSHDVVAPDGDWRDETVVRRAVEGAEVLFHLAPIAPDLPAGATEQEVLDLATRGTYVLLKAAVAAGVRRVVLGSTLAMLERYPVHWAVSESWQPRPDVTDVGQVAAYLAEVSAQQFAHVEPLEVVCLRFGTVVDSQTSKGLPYDPRWLHVDDAVQACTKALTATLPWRTQTSSGTLGYGWWVYHIPGGGTPSRLPLAAAGEERHLGYHPVHTFAHTPGSGVPFAPATTAELAGDLDLLGPREHIPSRPIRKVVIFGAGGPLGATTAQALAAAYQLRLTDRRSLAEIVAEGKPQSKGAPLPAVLPPPHDMLQVDVTDAAQVLQACAGMDAIINCTVVRPDPMQAFRVNFLGALHVLQAAVAHRIRRVVQTGPLLVVNDRPAGYYWDFAVPDDAPPRPGTDLYFHTKHLGQEVVRLFAETYDLEAPVLLFSQFVDPQTAEPKLDRINPMAISWEDAGLAMRRALETSALPSPYEVFHMLADLPQGKYSNAKARRLLNWQPRDNLAHLWARR